MAKASRRIELTKCESEVMDIVWEKECVTVNDVVDAIDRDLAYTTVLTTMRILEDKKIVHRGKKIGRAYTYTPLISRQQAREGSLKALADQFFGGSTRSLVLSMVNSKGVTPEDIQAMKDEIAKIEESS
ncbi:BlaI/MecI/CopY family transcriptional regulator [Planctomycetes bacterium TBK1r]|uniref:Penicillinase repressor n=1 Tax=Stieleria magnilauensis TaxID=2527963 RepID=A0ABX5XXP7_9BACT|nr:Penicillinase repressor [Planctomycetes bacterium TBK1r]